MTNAKIILDSLGPNNIRLTTMELTFARIVLSEYNTHRAFSRNSASSRAIPVEKQLKMVMENPFIPRKFPKNQKGMQSDEYYEPGSREYNIAVKIWLTARDKAVGCAETLIGKQGIYSDGEIIHLSVHKQIANRLLEPFMWHTVICTATDWQNFFALRDNDKAQLEIWDIAKLAKEVYKTSKPTPLAANEWHLPYVSNLNTYTEKKTWTSIQEYLGIFNKEDLLETAKKVSCARCARVSYKTFDGTIDIAKDVDLYNRLYEADPKHASAFEHVAMATDDPNLRSGNFRGWKQLRQTIPGHETPG